MGEDADADVGWEAEVVGRGWEVGVAILGSKGCGYEGRACCHE